jgi:hypothetical protein
MSGDVKSRILAAIAGFKPKAIEIPELGGTVYVRPLSLAGMSLVQSLPANAIGDRLSAMIADCLCDENGKRLFAGDEAGIANDLPGDVARRIIDAINAQSSASDKDVGIAAGE